MSENGARAIRASAIAFVLAGALIPAATPVTAATPHTVVSRVEEFGGYAQARLKPFFRASGVEFPPSRVVMLGLKQENRLELYAESSPGDLRFIRDYPVAYASGEAGPKMLEGDRQVPEGLYNVTHLNPNSRFHLSIGLNYPNAFDREMAWHDGRTTLGGDIFIHGGAASVGCLAMGDSVASELFVLAAMTGIGSVEVILSPRDFRRPGVSRASRRLPDWTALLYRDIARAMKALPMPPGR